MINRDEVSNAVKEAIEVNRKLGNRLIELWDQEIATESDLKLMAELDVWLHTAYGLLNPIDGDEQ